MKDILQDIDQYNQRLFVSQVIALLGRKGVHLSKAMVNNYVRDKVLPPPVGKRYYTAKHLAALVLIDYLKPLYEMDDIRAALAPHMDEEGIPLDVYRQWVALSQGALQAWGQAVAPLLDGAAPLLLLHAADVRRV